MTVVTGTTDPLLTSADLDGLVYGGTAEHAVLEKLVSGQIGRYKLLLCAVMRHGALAVPAAGPMLREYYDLLAAVERQAPAIVTAVLRCPHVGAWAARCLRQLWRDPGSAAPDLDYLGAIAASAVIQAGYPCSLTLRLRDGALMLPALGRLTLSGTHATIAVSGQAGTTITSDDHTISFPAEPHADAPSWQGLRMLAMGDRFLFLDDLDPNRNYDPYPLLERLGAKDVARWQDILGEAWHLLTLHHPRYAAALHDGLRSLVPIGQRVDDKNVSATSGDAFGAVATSLPSDGAALAVALMHEFQHAKLCALADLEPLFDRDDRNLLYAPWRPDPRPVGPLFQGIFAHMAVTEFWRVHRRVASGQQRIVADVEFARWLRQTHQAAVLLNGHHALTATGRELLSHVTARLADWLKDSVPGPALKLATEISSDHLSNWRLRNLRPDADDIERLARSWLADGPASGVVRTTIREVPLTSGRTFRTDLLYLRLRDPARFDLEARDSGGDPDIAYARGDRQTAIRGYLAQLKADRRRVHAWTGLGIAIDPCSPLARFPDVAFALHTRLAHLGGSAADPLRLAEWLDGISTADLDVQV